MITLPDYFQIFCEDKLSFNYAVKLYDPLSEMFEIYVDTDESLRMILFGFSRYITYYGLTVTSLSPRACQVCSTTGDISLVERVLKVRFGVRYPLTTTCLAKWGDTWGEGLGCIGLQT